MRCEIKLTKSEKIAFKDYIEKAKKQDFAFLAWLSYKEIARGVTPYYEYRYKFFLRFMAFYHLYK